MALFDRITAITVGKPGSQNGIEISGLRTTFSVVKTNDKTTNKAIISIYNLNQDTYSKLEEANNSLIKGEYTLTLRAGYLQGEGLQNIFTGNVTTVTNKPDVPDNITTISCNDGFRALRNEKLSISYNAGSKVKDILNDVISTLGISKKSNSIDIPDSEFVNGFSFAGGIKDFLQKSSDKLGLQWSFQDNELKFYAKDGSDKNSIYSLSPDTGLIKSPERVSDISGNAKKAVPGWNFEAFLLPSIEPGNRIQVSSIALPTPTVFVVSRVEHKGDTRGQNFSSSILANEL